MAGAMENWLWVQLVQGNKVQNKVIKLKTNVQSGVVVLSVQIDTVAPEVSRRISDLQKGNGFAGR
jgi:hypothetical protein